MDKHYSNTALDLISKNFKGVLFDVKYEKCQKFMIPACGMS